MEGETQMLKATDTHPSGYWVRYWLCGE